MKTIAILLGLTCALYGSPIPDFPFIYVKGHAYEEIPTNLAIIRFDIAKHSRVSDEGESALSDASKTIRKALRDLGVNDKEINSSEVLKREEYGEFPQFQKKEEPRESFQLPPLDGPDEVEQTKNKKESYYTLRQRFVLQIKDGTIGNSVGK